MTRPIKGSADFNPNAILDQGRGAVSTLGTCTLGSTHLTRPRFADVVVRRAGQRSRTGPLRLAGFGESSQIGSDWE